MQKKLERIDVIIRDTYASGEFIFEEYTEATELLVKLSNELKLLDLACVIKAEGKFCPDCGKRKNMKGDGTIELLCEC